jgi:hypothetical protein
MTNSFPLVNPFSLDRPSLTVWKAHPVVADRGDPRARDRVQIKRPPVVWAASLLAQSQCGTRFALNKGRSTGCRNRGSVRKGTR